MKEPSKGRESRKPHVRQLEPPCESNRSHEACHEMRKEEQPSQDPVRGAKGLVRRDKAVQGRKG